MSNNSANIVLTHEKIAPEFCRNLVMANTVGGECHFIGTVRDNKDGEEVKYLFFEAYEPMAISELHKIASEAKNKFDITDLLIHHRLGKVEVGEIAVIIIATSAHRNAAFDACRFAIDTLKVTVPIWKKEVMNDGFVWVSAHP